MKILVLSISLIGYSSLYSQSTVASAQPTPPIPEEAKSSTTEEMKEEISQKKTRPQHYPEKEPGEKPKNKIAEHNPFPPKY